MSLSEIIVRHQLQSEIDKQASDMNQQFVVDTPNNYESAEDAQKIVEMNIIDILYDNKVSILVYMRDITSYVKQNPLIIAQKEAEDEDLDEEKITRALL